MVINNRQEAERWLDKVDALQQPHGVSEVSTCENAMQAVNATNTVV